MAIKSLNQRLDELSSQGDSQLKPIVEMPTDGAGINLDNVERLDYEIQEPYEGNDVQVASLPGKFVTGVSRMFSKETKELASQAAQEVAPKPITPSPDKAVVIPKLKDVPQPKSIEDLQTALVEAKTAGTPPDVLVNLNRIEGEEDFKRMVDALNITSGVKVEKMSFEELQRMAVERGYGNGFLSELTDIKEIYADIAPDIMRLRFASYNNAEITVKLFEQANKNPADMETKAKLLYHINLHTALTETYTSVRSGAARATAAGNIIIPSSTSDEMAKLLSNPEVDANLKKLAEKMGMLLEQSQKEGLINKVSKVGLAMDLWDRTWKNGLLSGLGTHVVNLTSNTTFLFGSIATRQLAGFVGVGKRALGREAEVEFGEAASMIAGIVHSWRDAFRLGYVAAKTGTTKEMREGIDIGTDAGVKIEGQYGVFDAKDYGIETEWMVKGLNFWGQFVTFLGGRPIMAMDEVFKTLAYRAELYAQGHRAMKQATRKGVGDGLSPEEADILGLKALGETLGNPSDEINDVAKDFSHMITYSRALTGKERYIQEIAQEHLLGRIILPFVKTPVWILSESTQHSPFALLSKQWRADMAAGGSRRELAQAKMGVGMGVMVGAGSFVADGRMTGGGPGNTQLRQQYLASGWRPYSFVFDKDEWDSEFADWLKSVNIDVSVGEGGKLYVQFRGIDPIAGPLAMVADAVEYARYEDDQDIVGQVILGAAYGLYNYVGQSSFMTALSSITGSFATTIPNPKTAFKEAINAVVKQGTSYAIEGSPVGIYNSARGMVARTIDPARKDVTADPNLPTGLKGWYEGLNLFKAKTPGMTDDLPDRYDVFGEQEYYGDPSAPWVASMTGIRYSESRQREVDKIVIALDMPLSKPTRSISVGEEGEKVLIKLKPADYQLLLKLVGQVTKPMTNANGNTVNQNVQQAIVTTAKTSAFKMADKDEQQIMIQTIYGEYVNMATEALLERRPSINIKAEAESNRQSIKGKYKQ